MQKVLSLAAAPSTHKQRAPSRGIIKFIARCLRLVKGRVTSLMLSMKTEKRKRTQPRSGAAWLWPLSCFLLLLQARGRQCTFLQARNLRCVSFRKKCRHIYLVPAFSGPGVLGSTPSCGGTTPDAFRNRCRTEMPAACCKQPSHKHKASKPANKQASKQAREGKAKQASKHAQTSKQTNNKQTSKPNGTETNPPEPKTTKTKTDNETSKQASKAKQATQAKKAKQAKQANARKNKKSKAKQSKASKASKASKQASKANNQTNEQLSKHTNTNK